MPDDTEWNLITDELMETADGRAVSPADHQQFNPYYRP
jgi:hypothetical protein